MSLAKTLPTSWANPHAQPPKTMSGDSSRQRVRACMLAAVRCAGAHPGEPREALKQFMDESGVHGASIHTKAGITPLHLAAENGRTDAIALLADKRAGGNAEARDKAGHTPLHMAAEAGRTAAVQALLGPPVSAPVDVADANGWTAFHYAAWAGNAPALRVLYEGHAKVERREKKRGCTALILAAFGGRVAAVNFLLHGVRVQANIQATDQSQWTALHWAAFGGHMAVVEALLSPRIDVELFNELAPATTAKGTTALQLAKRQAAKSDGDDGGGGAHGEVVAFLQRVQDSGPKEIPLFMHLNHGTKKAKQLQISGDSAQPSADV